MATHIVTVSAGAVIVCVMVSVSVSVDTAVVVVTADTVVVAVSIWAFVFVTDTLTNEVPCLAVMVVGFVQVEVTVFVVIFVVVLVPGSGRCNNFAQTSLLTEEYLENVLITAAMSLLVQALQPFVRFSTAAGGMVDALAVKQRDSSENRTPKIKALPGECILKDIKQKQIADGWRQELEKLVEVNFLITFLTLLCRTRVGEYM